MTLEAIKYENDTLEILDQLLLPGEHKYIPILSVEDGWKAIKLMQVRMKHMHVTVTLSLVLSYIKIVFSYHER